MVRPESPNYPEALARLRRNRLVGRIVTVILRPLLAKKTDPAFPELRRVFRGDFFLSTGLIL